MSLIKTRPKIQLILPSYARPGDDVVAEVVLVAKRPVPVRSLTCRLIGEEKVSFRQGNNLASRSHVLCAFEADVLGDREDDLELPEGESRFKVKFALPAGLPPRHRAVEQSWGSVGATVDYVVHVEAAIPWWPNAKAGFVLVVELPPKTVADPGSSLHASAVEGPSGKEPHVEFSLGTRQVLPGDTLRGALALSNVAYNRYRKAELSLVGTETLYKAPGQFAGQVEQLRFAIAVDVEGVEEGESVPFAMKLPEALPATYGSQLWSLDWAFEVKTAIAWGNDLVARVPMTVLPKGSQRRSQPRKAAPRIGNKRLSELWSRIATRRGLSFDAEEGAMRGEVGDVELRIRRDHRGGDGRWLVADLRLPSLGLGLDGGLASSLRRVVGGGVAIGDPKWDKDHYLTGREEPQVEAFAAALADVLRRLRVADLDDDQWVVERRGGGQTDKALTLFARDVQALAAALPAAIGAIPCPTAMRDHEAGWLALAKRLGGALRKADMTLTGRFEGARVEASTVWTSRNEAAHTSLTYSAEDIAAERDVVTWGEGGPVGDPAGLSKRARTLAQKLADEALSLSIATDRLVLWDPRAPLGADEMSARFEQLAALAAALQARGGPYR